MAHPMGESKRDGLRVDFDRRLKLEFHGSKITSDGGLLAYRELDDALGLTEVAGTIFQDSRTGKNGWHGMTGQFRQSVFGRLGGYEDVNDADRLGRDPAMRWIVGGKAVERQAASTSQMGRFETELLVTDANIEVLACLDGAHIAHPQACPRLLPASVSGFQCQPSGRTLKARPDRVKGLFNKGVNIRRTGQRGRGCGSRLHGVASFLGLSTPSLRLRGSNATLIQSFNKYRDIPKLSAMAVMSRSNWPRSPCRKSCSRKSWP